MVDERYTEALANGTALLESGRNIPEAAKCFLKARSWASTDKQRFQALLGHAKALFALADMREIGPLMLVVEPLLKEGSEAELQVLSEIREGAAAAVKAKAESAAQDKEKLALAIKAAGGAKPEDPKFIPNMKTRADQGLVEGGWEQVEKLLRDCIREKTVLKLASKMAASAGPTASKAGGVPYSEPGEKWPVCKQCGKAMQFCFQIDCQQGPHIMPSAVGLTVVYMCSVDGTNDIEPQPGTWEVRNYLEPSAEKFEPMNSSGAAAVGAEEGGSGQHGAGEKGDKATEPYNKREWQFELNKRHQTSTPFFEILPQEAPELVEALQQLYPPDVRRCYERLINHYKKERKQLEVANDFVVGGYPSFYNGEFIARDSAGNAMTYVWTVSSLDDYFNFCDDGYLSLYYSPVLNQFRLFIETT